jgi:hypothetical protein
MPVFPADASTHFWSNAEREFLLNESRP